ncbi:unnamed protein product [Mycena citricolor]|uniref:Uncharacterized protein n=1 Tax=Mycena citricolor TaxID=2018698 RepID=A0AAD2Q774_9AGAR|nr:unnamed protein product [Mycena citricolor]
MPEDVFLSSPRKAPAHRRSATSLRGPSSLANTLDGGEDAGNGRFSLAHELAVAMMPEPSSGSKLLAEEFGIEFDEGAEGIDEPDRPQTRVEDPTFAEPDPQLLDSAAFDHGSTEPPDFGSDPTFASPSSVAPKEEAPVSQDAMETLAQDLKSTDNFLAHLRHIDGDAPTSAPAASSSSSQPALEQLASDVIRRYNDTARDRESQVRELLEYEREFRRIAGEVGGQDVLGHLDALPEHESEVEAAPPSSKHSAVHEDEPAPPPVRPSHARALSTDWEVDPDADGLDPAFNQQDDEDAEISPPAAHLGFSLSPPITAATPRVAGRKPGPAAAAQLSELRSLTASLVSSLTSVSEQAQVNGAATAEAGRKLRALRNRLGGWRTEWEGAERSRGRIERWEAGEALELGGDAPAALGSKRVDGRKIVEEHLHAFELALADAASKTQAMMAAS